MAARSGGSSFVQPLHPPSPKSPPKYPDLFGKRRERAKVQMLEREISFLEEELKSIEGFQPASRYCKEVTDFVMANSDPLIQLRKNQKSCGFWKWLCGLPCFNMACTSCCCNSGCCCYLKCPECWKCSLCDCSSCNCMSCKCCISSDCNACKCSSCDCSSCNCGSCFSCCKVPKWQCCCRKMCCCNFQPHSCTNCCSCKWKCYCPKCPKLCNCFSCTKTCCNPCC
ncbi:hypothetical protein E1A91_D06G090400v1 [Gossypium mustelinum]|uniref:G protein gamma domain-containing protein n=1 Tax=Gossypium mustelinum TaxID=34275 RepID=A0A5D2UG55_GOSMU|nr:hypothetical protein E1A91_D06G090400v1 [Gossypium mustelinum]